MLQTPASWEAQLRKEGFSMVYVHTDEPEEEYPDHTHPVLAAHIILKGEMTLTINGKSKKYMPFQRIDVPANTVHAAKMGPQGCTYVVGGK